MEKRFILGIVVGICQYLDALQIKSIHEIMKNRHDIKYVKCYEAQEFNYLPFPISMFPERQPSSGVLAESFIVNIPNGQIYSNAGFVKINDDIMAETVVYQENAGFMYLTAVWMKMLKTPLKIISGKVAVIMSDMSNCYFHWMRDVLGKLILLKQKNIAYDWLYICLDKPYMKESLQLLGVDCSKIIEPQFFLTCLQADELIVPSSPGRRVFDNGELYEKKNSLAAYCDDWIIKELRNAFLSQTKNVSRDFSKRVFLSRDDALYRNVKNEDAVFKIFEKRGFKKYCLSSLSLLEQVTLFNYADVIVGPHGSGFFNIIFCKQGTKVIEIFQKRSDSSFFYIAQHLGLDYSFLKTTKFVDGHAFGSSVISLAVIQDFLSGRDDF